MTKKLKKMTGIGLGFVLTVALGSWWFIRTQSDIPFVPCRYQLLQIQAAKDNWAIENKASSNDIPSWNILIPYLHGLPKGSTALHCPAGGKYELGSVGVDAKCSLGDH